MFEELKAFFEENPLAQKAAKSIKDGRKIAILVSKKKTTKEFTFTKEDGKNTFLEGAPESPDLTFVLPEDSASDLVTRKFESVGQVGVHVFEKMLSSEPHLKIEVKLHKGFLDLVMGGYLEVLAIGGTDVAKFLGTKGLGSFSKMKEAINKLKQ